MQTEEQVRQGIELGFFEHGQEIGAAHEDQGGDFVEHIDEHDWNGDQRTQDHHLLGMGLVDRLEQAVERQDQKHGDDLVDQFARDTDSEKPLGSPDVVGRRGRVPRHDQLAGDIQKADGSDECESQIQESGDSCLLLG